MKKADPESDGITWRGTGSTAGPEATVSGLNDVCEEGKYRQLEEGLRCFLRAWEGSRGKLQSDC